MRRHCRASSRSRAKSGDRRLCTHQPGHHAGKRLDVAGHDLALGDAQCLQVLDDRRDELRVAGRRQIVKAEGLDAEHDAVDRRHGGLALRREQQRTRSQRLQKIAATRNHERAPSRQVNSGVSRLDSQCCVR